MVMAKDIVYALTTSNKTTNNKQVAQILGVHRRNIKRAIERRHTLDKNEDAFWLQRRTRKHANALCEVAVQ
jgi:phage regulator Rha-like protein